MSGYSTSLRLELIANGAQVGNWGDTTNNNLEVYDNSQWSAVGVPSFTVIVNDQFAGDGVNVAFTLSETASTDSVIVSINGVVQIPTTAYSVSGTTLTFGVAPPNSSFIEVTTMQVG
mgnify:CR=1 FL=1